MKVRSSIKRRTRDCQIVVRKGKRFVINKKNPRLKQRLGRRAEACPSEPVRGLFSRRGGSIETRELPA